MLFGTKEHFAIEAMSETALRRPSAVWGRMQVWCQGVSIGDYSDEHCGLYGSYVGFKELGGRLPRLWREEFSGLSDTELWNLLDGRLYGFHGELELDDRRTLEQCQADARTYGIFNFLTNWGEQFDRGGKSFIVCTPAQQVRVLNRCLPPGHGIALGASLFLVCSAIAEFLEWFEKESARLGHAFS